MTQQINPMVYAAAARFTDGAITDGILADVAAMEGLPLYVERPAPGASDLAAFILFAKQEYVHAIRRQRWALAFFNASRRRRVSEMQDMVTAGARASLADANRRRVAAYLKLRRLEAQLSELSATP